MTNLEIREELAKLREKYKVDEIKITYYGSGDSFASYDVYTKENIDIQDSDIEPVFWELVENRANSDFNDDGSEGIVILNLKACIAKIEDYSLYTAKDLNADITIK